MKQEIQFINDKNMEEEIRLLKNFVLDRISAISFRLGRVSCKANVTFEYELVKNAIDFLSTTNINDKETFQKLLAYYFIFVGMSVDFDSSITYSLQGEDDCHKDLCSFLKPIPVQSGLFLPFYTDGK